MTGMGFVHRTSLDLVEFFNGGCRIRTNTDTIDCVGREGYHFTSQQQIHRQPECKGVVLLEELSFSCMKC